MQLNAKFGELSRAERGFSHQSWSFGAHRRSRWAYRRTMGEDQVQRAYRGRQPSAPMEAAELIRVIELLSSSGIEVWVDGGWGVDALLERQTREHDDLDLVTKLDDSTKVIGALEAGGYELVDGAPPQSFVLVDAVGRQVDVHPVIFDDARGGGVYEMRDGREWVYPMQGFTGRGQVNGINVRCLSPEVQVLVHDGYELTDKDYWELRLLHDRFGVDIPERYRARALRTQA